MHQVKEYIDRDLILTKVLKKGTYKKIVEKLTKKYPIKIAEDKKGYYLLEICSDRHQEDEMLKEFKNGQAVVLE